MFHRFFVVVVFFQATIWHTDTLLFFGTEKSIYSLDIDKNNQKSYA